MGERKRKNPLHLNLTVDPQFYLCILFLFFLALSITIKKFSSCEWRTFHRSVGRLHHLKSVGTPPSGCSQSAASGCGQCQGLNTRTVRPWWRYVLYWMPFFVPLCPLIALHLKSLKYITATYFFSLGVHSWINPLSCSKWKNSQRKKWNLTVNSCHSVTSEWSEQWTETYFCISLH